VDDEALMDAVTAVSGSGPAYSSCWPSDGAGWSRGGLPAALAESSRARRSRARAILHRSPLPAATLRQNVTSPGGTTAAALEVLMAAAASRR
jgi:pyrroline-5-carboxylate reductase